MSFKCSCKYFSNKNILSVFLLVLCSYVKLSESLYEDQIGKFDWKQRYVGKIKDAHFHDLTNDRIIVATEDNVLAALSVKNGEILWRKVFEKSDRGDIQLLHVLSDPSKINRDNDIITISGTSPALVRGWDANTGNLDFEWSLTPTTNSDNTLWFYGNLYVYHVVLVYNSHIELTAYFGSTGQQVNPTTVKISAAWISPDRCVLTAPFYACAIKDQLIAIDLTSDNNELLTKKLNKDSSSESINILKGADATVVIGNDIYRLKSDETLVKAKPSEIMFNVHNLNSKNILIHATVKDKSIQISSQNLESGEQFNDIYLVADYPEQGVPQIFDVRCKSKSDGKPATCRMLMSTDDGAIILMQQGKIKWIRQEALTDIVAIEMIDLPLSDAEGSIENELKNKDGDIFNAWARRISTQILQIKNLFLTVMGLGAPPSASQKAGLIRDAFGLHKMIVAVTGSGKIFGIDNLSGKHHWVKYLPNFVSFNKDNSMKLVVQRTSRHFPQQALCAVLAKNKNTGKGILFQFNPISGNPFNGGIQELDYKIQQFIVLAESKEDFLKPLLIFDKENNAHVLPASSAAMAHGTYLYTANKDTNVMSGYFIKYQNQKLSTQLIWEINLGGNGNIHQITNIATKSSIEHVHSQGRVFNDRSVLYKYINPNLVVVATQGPDTIHKHILSVHFIDVVSGSVVATLSHKRVKGPLHMVHSENWLVYSYYNDKVRRTEITTVELYEGKSQTNSTVWSSLDAPQLPMVERQSYILPANVVSLKETITEKGITNKHVLIALASGSVVEMPWALLDPRRPILLQNQAREEGIIPYIPELQMPTENVVNYNQSVANIRGIYTAPSGLESTCLVVTYGLDIFVTRVAPSKTFDLLKEDFDYILITVVLTALSIASFVAKHLSSRKAIKQAWK